MLDRKSFESFVVTHLVKYRILLVIITNPLDHILKDYPLHGNSVLQFEAIQSSMYDKLSQAEVKQRNAAICLRPT
ncbi:hypothetical protein CEXT_120501 [Caerostris extrusa]|uniref:Uncharacterized protein n=1 Tax=Caerostris extrusa TaxID=172846 RepID=A0AAV4VUV0_CAEEX|nr:hypothetical protein CEXT_120501 [Caerostris extrusa]